MTTLKIWGRMSSINVKKVVWTAQELALDFQRTEAGGLFGVVKTPGYVQLNPNSLVPVIEDDDYVLWESNVIVRYLCAKFDTPTLAASRAALPPEGAGLAWGGPARRPLVRVSILMKHFCMFISRLLSFPSCGTSPACAA